MSEDKSIQPSVVDAKNISPTPVFSHELMSDSPILQSMLKIGRKVITKGQLPKNIQEVNISRGEAPLIKFLLSPWNKEGNQAFGQVDLGLVKDGKFSEGFKVEWILEGAKKKPGYSIGTTASITAGLRRKPTFTDKHTGMLHQSEMSLTLSRSGNISVSINPQIHPEVKNITIMNYINDNDYNYYGQISNIPINLEHLLVPILKQIENTLP
jgi:hypothetical protein